jgi:ketosteroid isomerase-like protein
MTDIEVVAAIYEAMAARDIARLLELIDRGVVITQDDRLPWGGRFEGHAGFAQFAAALTGTITSAVTHDELFAADGDVVQVGHTRGTVNATGKQFDIAEVHRWTIKDGKAVKAHFSIDTPGMLVVLEAGA